MWQNNDLAKLLGTQFPLIQAPMAGANDAKMAAAVSAAGGLGSLPCAMLDLATMRTQVEQIRAQTDQPFNLNFFCHTPAQAQNRKGQSGHDQAWREYLAPYYQELGLDPNASAANVNRAPFDEAMCELVEALKPAVVSFHFGLPSSALVARVKAAGSVVLSSATTVAEAIWLEQNGCDAIIVQGLEAGGHRGMFLTDDIYSQVGTMALLPQVADAVSLPLIAAGGIADERGIVAALALGASGVQLGSAYLRTTESKISALHREALANSAGRASALTNVFSGKPARGLMTRIMSEVGPMSDKVPVFPTAGGALAPLKAKAEAQGRSDFTSLWSGQAGALAKALGAGELTQELAQNTQKYLANFS